MRRIALIGFASICVLSAIGFYQWQWHRPERVFVSYSEKYEDKEKAENDDVFFAEEQLSDMIAQNNTCMVLTHDKKHADYYINISVIRFVGGGDTYGEASLSITRSNGDVVLAEHFFQNRQSKEDIARQPITRAWAMLCDNK